MVAVLSARVPAPVVVPAAPVKQESSGETAGAAPPIPLAPMMPPLGAVTVSRDAAYRTLSEIAEYLMELEPHSPTPFLVRRAAAWGDMSLGELIQEANEAGLDIGALFTFLGINEDVE
jgi:predicted component of type VI protein secretion system